MANWVPVLKQVLPHIANIVGAAIPAFTAKAAAGKNSELVSTQISELQAESIRSADYVKSLATQLQEAIKQIEAGGDKLQQELIVLRRLSLFALVLSVIALSAIVLVLLNKAV